MGGDSSFKKKNKKKKKPHVVDMASRTPNEEYSRLCVDRACILERTAVAARRGSVYPGRDLAHGELPLAF